MLFDKIFNFKLCKRDIIKIIVGFIIIGITIYFFKDNFKEGLNATSCTNYKDCSSCTTGSVNDLPNPCFWNSEKKQCGSFEDPGYSKTCDNKPQTPTCSSTFKDCDSCLKGTVDNYKCFWNPYINDCGSSNSVPGYSTQCNLPGPPGPTPGPTPGPPDPGPPGPGPPGPHCPRPQLTWLKPDTYITTQKKK